MGTKIMRKIEIELSKSVNVAKFLMPDIQEALGHFKRATEIYPGHTSSWINMGMIYNNPRIGEHLMARGDTSMYLDYKRSAVSSFSKAIELEPGDGKALFNLGFTYENLGKIDSALYYYEQCIRFNPQIINPRSRMANLMFMQGKIDEALEYNRQIMYIDPNESLPYVNFGNYYMMMGDTIKAITNFEEAALRNARPEVYAFLAQYYTEIGNTAKAREYDAKYNAALRSQ
jgi:Flp pilus assembly protein TadD